jgi:hypothetical protein
MLFTGILIIKMGFRDQVLHEHNAAFRQKMPRVLVIMLAKPFMQFGRCGIVRIMDAYLASTAG